MRDDSAVDDLIQRVMLVVLSKLRGGEVREPERIDSFVLGTARMVTRELLQRLGECLKGLTGNARQAGVMAIRSRAPRRSAGYGCA